MNPYISVIIKPTYACNADCSYCEVHKLGKYFKPMSIDTYELLHQRLYEYFIDYTNKTKNKVTVTFHWLGGEPLLMGDDFYKEVYRVSKNSSLSKIADFIHTFQSNLTLFANKDFKYVKKLLVDFAQAEEADGSFFISTSADPVSDARTLKNKESYEKVFLEALYKVKNENGKYGAVYTIHSGSVGKEREIYYFFKNLDFKAINLNAVSDYQTKFNPDTLKMTPKEFGQCLKNFWKVWEEDDYGLNITPFISWKRLKDFGDSSELRCFNDGLCNKNLFAIGPNGDIFVSDRAIQSRQKPIGNLKSDNLKEVLKKRYHQDRILYIKEHQCKGCSWWEYCKGSCPYESIGEFENRFDKSYWCEGYKMLFEYITK